MDDIDNPRALVRVVFDVRVVKVPEASPLPVNYDTIDFDDDFH